MEQTLTTTVEAEPSQSTLQVREWTPDDTLQLLSWLEDDPDMIADMGFKTPSEMVEAITSIMASPHDVALAVEEDGELIGYMAGVGFMPDGSGHAHMGLAPAHRGRGPELAKLGVETWFSQPGLSSIIVAVPRTRRGKVLERFYRKHGFHETEAKLLILRKSEYDNGSVRG